MSRVDIVFSAPSTRIDGSALDPSEIASCSLRRDDGRSTIVVEWGDYYMSATDTGAMPTATYAVETTLSDGTTSRSEPAPVEVVPGPSAGTVDSAKYYE